MKISQKGFIIPLIIAIVALIAIAGTLYVNKNITVEAPIINTPTNIVGGDKDIHGCIGSAGYSWCAIKNKCLRVWEEKCETTTVNNIATSSYETVNWKTYTNTQYGFEFKYPSLISLKQDGEIVTLKHSIFYKHPNLCDFKGDAPPLDNLTDFSVSIMISNKSLDDIKKDNFVWNYEKFEKGSLSGFKGESGVEGCGMYTYLFPISTTKTLVIKRSYIPEFNPINADYKNYLGLPGVISPNQEETYFNQILSTFKFIEPTVSTCTCPADYVQEGDSCNPNCYYSTPKCLIPSVQCTIK